MLVGRYFVIIPMMAVAGSLVAKRAVPPSAGTFPTHGPLFVGLLIGVILILGGLTFFPALALGPIVEHLADDRPHAVLTDFGVTTMEASKLRKRMPVAAMLDPKIAVPAIGQAFVKLDPRTLVRNPVIFVLEIVTLLATALMVRDFLTVSDNLGFTMQIVLWLWFTVLFANFAEAVAEGRGRAQADTLRRARSETVAKRLLMPDNNELYEGVTASELAGRRPGRLRGRRRHSGRRRGDRGHRLRQRGGGDRRVRARDPRIRRRPVGGDRRHHRHFGPHHRSHHRLAGQFVSRPHDRAGRRRRTAEDAERDRAQHPAGRADHYLRVRHRHHSELHVLCRRLDSRPSSWWRCS